jgi:hypothetical protein
MSLIVVGTDGSKGSQAANREGIDLAKRVDAKILSLPSRRLCRTASGGRCGSAPQTAPS